jgi:hypothetical protein
MKRPLGAFLALALAAIPAMTMTTTARADDKDPQAILDKAIKALGGEEKLKKADAFTWKTKGTISFGGNDSEYTGSATAQGIDHLRRELEFDANGEKRSVMFIVAGDKGWMKFGDQANPLEEDMLANQRRGAYLEVIPITILPLKGKGFKVESAAEEKVDGKPAAGIKVTPPDGKDFTLYFDKETGLPAKVVARVVGFQGEENTNESTFKDYKDFGGLKKATKVETRRDGEDFIKSEISDFKVLDKVDPKTFSDAS